MAPAIPALFLLVLVQAVHVLSVDLIVRKPKDFIRQNDYRMSFYNHWYSQYFDMQKGPLQLRCYAILYRTKNPLTVEIKSMEIARERTEHLSFYIRPGAFKFGWRIQCDYRFLPASKKALKAGIVLLSGPNASRCLRKNMGCAIVFTRGEARRLTNYGDEFIGELYETKCSWPMWRCGERAHPKFMFGQPCPGSCNFRSIW